ncbi:Hypothetical_protein [Hexamita inflata]|uniref:Hypothetical_protein n=1 Tax=Hexamita inflata TaxID=28002 RepID=A0AA86N7A9_9EUKA|nr:Hypothetical protein HINF_LOCUS1686 [Hexamita inflata]
MQYKTYISTNIIQVVLQLLKQFSQTVSPIFSFGSLGLQLVDLVVHHVRDGLVVQAVLVGEPELFLHLLQHYFQQYIQGFEIKYDVHIENSQGILTRERLRAFEGELFRAIQQYFAETPFQTLKEAIVHHKAFCARTGKKVHLNFAQLGETCGLSESQARNAFETVKQQRLDFLEPEMKRGLLERLRQLWEAETAEDFATKRKIVVYIGV